MGTISKASGGLVLAGLVLIVGDALALSPGVKCEASKLGTAGKYELCRMQAEAKAVKIGGNPDFSKCDAKLNQKWAAAETKGHGTCPSNGDEAVIKMFIAQHAGSVAAELAGGTLTATTCGNGVVDPGEDCDFGTLNSQTCATNGFVGGTLACGAGCVFDTSGCWNTRFVDNGDGTVTDRQTGLMWERKENADGIENASDPHDADNRYTWCKGTIPDTCADGTNPPDGTAFTEFLVELNYGASLNGFPNKAITGCFAGHCDWRLPSVVELQGIIELDACPGGPCIDAAFGPTQAALYWSTTTATAFPNYAWFVTFAGGGVNSAGKPFLDYVRAVRGGVF